MPTLTHEGPDGAVTVLDLGPTENRFGPDLLARVLTLPMVTVAAIPGHAFAAGAMLTLAHDIRVMRADRGFWCLPEADLSLPFSPGMSTLITQRLGPVRAHEAMVTGRRYGGEDARAANVVDETAPADRLRTHAVEIAARHVAKAGPALGTIKTTLHGSVASALRAEPATSP